MPEKTQAQKKAQRRYIGGKALIQVVTDPEQRDKIKAHVELMGYKSMNLFILHAIEQQIIRDTQNKRHE